MSDNSTRQTLDVCSVPLPHFFLCVHTGCWSATLGKDAYRPKPMGSFSFCKFSCSKAILFGGRSEDNGRSYSNEMYHFDLESRVSKNLFSTS